MLKHRMNVKNTKQLFLKFHNLLNKIRKHYKTAETHKKKISRIIKHFLIIQKNTKKAEKYIQKKF